MRSNSGAVLFAFGCYMAMMILVGVLYMKKTRNSKDYFLGGRNLNGWIAAMSAQASDMSSWLLMGLPGTIYAFGTGQIWIAVGLLLGSAANWFLVSRRLYSYTVLLDASTVPEYYEKRFQDKKRILLVLSSVIIAFFFLIYTASALTSGGRLFSSVFGMEYHTALLIGTFVILLYTFLGGFSAVCLTDFIQATMMFFCILIIPIIAWGLLGGSSAVLTGLEASLPAGEMTAFLNPFQAGGSPLSWTQILSQLAWGLGYFGMPHILVRFMAAKNTKELRRARWIGMAWIFVTLLLACLIGILGRAYLYPEILGITTDISEENVFIEMILKMFDDIPQMAFIGGLFLCGILASIMSTADSQLLVTASAISRDLYKSTLHPRASEKSVLILSRAAVLAVSVAALWIAWDPENSIMRLVSNAWAGLGAAFGPVTLISLYWKRINLSGAIAGIACGGAAVILWDYIPVLYGRTLGSMTGIYSLLPGFLISSICIILVSLFTEDPSAQMLQAFDKVRSKR